MKRTHNNLKIDAVIIAFSVIATMILARLGIISTAISIFQHPLLESFIAGLFFTSVFTTAPAIAFFTYIAPTIPLITMAIVGGIGAVIGDLIIFRFVRDRFGKDLIAFLKEKQRGNHFKLLLHLKMFRYLTFLLGGLIIASPLPDELGIALLGFSKMKTRPFIILSFIFNTIGIAIIGYIATTF